MLNAISGNAPMFLSSFGTTTLYGNGLSAGTGGIVLTGGTFALSANNQIAAVSPLRLAGATLDVGAFSNTIAALTLSSSSTLGILVSSFTAGNFGNLTVNGYLNLGNATLNLTLSPGFSAPGAGTAIVLIRNVSNAAIVAQFAGLPDNSMFTVGSFKFLISYTGGAGHDSTLTSLIGLGLVIGARRWG
jgi:fibronectin-binding autotransporter adhesin